MKKSFTLLEHIIVIAIFCMLTAIVAGNVFKSRIKIKLNAIGSNMTASEVIQDSKKLEEVNRQFNEIKKVEKQNQEKIKSSDFESDVIGW